MEKTYLETIEEILLNQNTDLSQLTAEEQFGIISSKVANHPEAIMPIPGISSNELLDRLRKSKQTGKPLHVKLGIDPTGPDLHIGHGIALMMLRRFQRMGHHITLIIGEFTAKIGDPSGNMSERKTLTDEDIERNMKSYFQQAGKIIDLNTNIKTFKNSEWLAPMTMTNWIPILQKVSASQMFERSDFKSRVASGNSVSLAELMYSLFMAYDSVVLNPDIEVGGLDQFLNLHWCRELMKVSGQNPEVFICNDLLPGTDGSIDNAGRIAKMSKSKGNYIAVLEEPNIMFGKVMSIPDNIMWIWFRELTEISKTDLNDLKSKVESGDVHPMDAKKMLGRVIVATFNNFDLNIVKQAQESFEMVFQKSDYTEITDSYSIKNPTLIVDLLLALNFAASKSEAKRLIEQNAVKIADRVITNNEELIGESGVLKVGKKRIINIIFG